MMEFIRDTYSMWIDKKNQDLYYSCYLIGGELKTKDIDYSFVTTYDLLLLYENCQRLNIDNFKFLRKLIDIKLDKISTSISVGGEKLEFNRKIYKKLDEVYYFEKGDNMFDVKGYWNERYKGNRNSGSGSYGRLAKFKSEVINKFIKENKLKEIIEFGCGDGNQLQYFNIDKYIGIDISEEALRICKDKYQDFENKYFYSYEELYNLNQKVECAISLDVIYHLSDDEVYYRYLKDIFSTAKKYVIIYSNSTNYHFNGVDPAAGYVLFRDFNKDVENLYQDFTLIDIIPNEYPFSATIPDETSFADFYIYEKNSEKEINKEVLVNNFLMKKQLNSQHVLSEEINLHSIKQEEFNKLEVEKKSYVSKYEYEQKELVKVKEELKSYVSKYEYEQKELVKAKEELKSYASKYEYERKELLKTTEELSLCVSKYKYEQKMLEKTNKELKLIKQTKYYKLMKLNWKINSKLKFKTKKSVYGISRKLYSTFKYNKTAMGVFKKVNNKLNIIKDPKTLSDEYVKDIAGKNNNILKKQVKKISDIKVAVILDEFSYMSFKDEFNALILTPDNWREVMEKEKPDLFFCESAWSGTDSKLRPWRGKIYASSNFKKENRNTLIEIIKYCNLNNVPTIFWNKEDPTHYTDRIHDFVKTAVLFDNIFTTAEECVEMYKKDYGHKNVFVLPFATNPKMFNPIETSQRSKDIVFAGSWYKQHQKRCEEMEEIFDNILANGLNLKIYDRHSEVDDENHEFPDKYKQYIHKAVPFEEMPQVYKESEFSLNINTVVTSKTMFARRIFELASSNTLVLSNEFAGKDMFDNNIVIVDNNMDFSKMEEYKENNLINVLKNHTYSNRFRKILTDIEYRFVDEQKMINIIFYIDNPEDIDRVMKLNLNNKYQHSLLLSKNIATNTIKDYYEKYGDQINILSEHYLENYSNNVSIEEDFFVMLKDFNLYNEVERVQPHLVYLPADIGISLMKSVENYRINNIDDKYHNIMDKSVFSTMILQDNILFKSINVK